MVQFAEAARALECDEDEAHFNEALGKIAKQKPTELLDAKSQLLAKRNASLAKSSD